MALAAITSEDFQVCLYSKQHFDFEYCKFGRQWTKTH